MKTILLLVLIITTIGCLSRLQSSGWTEKRIGPGRYEIYMPEMNALWDTTNSPAIYVHPCGKISMKSILQEGWPEYGETWIYWSGDVTVPLYSFDKKRLAVVSTWSDGTNACLGFSGTNTRQYSSVYHIATDTNGVPHLEEVKE